MIGGDMRNRNKVDDVGLSNLLKILQVTALHKVELGMLAADEANRAVAFNRPAEFDLEIGLSFVHGPDDGDDLAVVEVDEVVRLQELADVLAADAELVGVAGHWPLAADHLDLSTGLEAHGVALILEI